MHSTRKEAQGGAEACVGGTSELYRYFKAVAEIYNKIEPVGPHSDDEWQSLRVMLTRCEIARFFHMD